MPDRLICSLGLYYGIEEDSAWNTINQLYTQGIINQRAKENLQYIVTFATTLRLKTYLHNKEQVDNISVFADSNLQLDGIFSLSKKDLSEQGSLFKYFYTALPLHDMLKQFCVMHDQNVFGDKGSFFRKSTFYRDDATTKGFIYYKLLQLQEARRYLEQAREVDESPTINYILGRIYAGSGNDALALQHFKLFASKNSESDYVDNRSFVVSQAFKNQNIASILSQMGQDEEVKQSNNTKTLLIKAICDGNMKEIEILISKKADINKADKEGASPLYYSLGYARQPINLNIVKLLLDSNANPNQEMCDGDTPMHMAHYKSNVEAVQLLLEYGANPHQCNHKGKTSLRSLLESDRYTNEEKVQFVNALTQYCGDIFTNSDPISTLYNVILSQVQPLLSEITESKEGDRETAVTGKNINSEVASLDDEQAISDLAREVTLSTQENTQELAGGTTEISHELDEF